VNPATATARDGHADVTITHRQGAMGVLILYSSAHEFDR
jgi:hypothetical protein